MQNSYRTRHLVAQEQFYYDGRTLGIGERFSATPQHAMILEGLSKARADDDAPTQAPSAEDDNLRTVFPTDDEADDSADSASDTEAERVERNKKRRERRDRRVLHTSSTKVD